MARIPDGDLRARPVTPERLGTTNIWAIWLPEPHQSLANQIPYPFACPACGFALDTAHLLDEPWLADDRVGSAAAGCPTCGATLHFNRTAEADRDSLSWVQRLRSR